MWRHSGHTTQRASVVWGIIKTLKQDHRRPPVSSQIDKDKQDGETSFWNYLRSFILFSAVKVRGFDATLRVTLQVWIFDAGTIWHNMVCVCVG